MRTLSICAMVIAGLGGLLNAQTPTGAIVGDVRDRSGGVIPGVTVTATGAGEPRKAVTNIEGHFRLEGLPAGGYQVDSVLSGFRRTSAAVVVKAGADVRQDFTLAIGIVTSPLYATPRDGLAGLVRAADVVMHLRITQVLSPMLLGPERTSLTTEHVASVLTVLKGGAPDLAAGRVVHFWQADAGAWLEDGQTSRGGNRVYSANDELVGLFTRDQDARLVEYIGGLATARVSNGKISLRLSGTALQSEVQSGMTLDAYVAALRKLIVAGRAQ